jgi:hypothetical protein
MIADNKRTIALEVLKAHAAELRTKIEQMTANIKQELVAVEKSIQILSGVPTQDLSSAAATEGLSLGGEYSGLGPQAAAEKYLNEHPGKTFRPREAAELMKKEGFTVSNPKLATQQVAIALGRAAKKGLAIETKINGKKAFRSAKHEGRVG